ncbi:hypothetical protein V3C99_007588 [Haemonchus contortus]
MSTQQCDPQDAELMMNPIYVISQVVHVLFSTLTIIIIVLMGRGFMKVRVHKNVKRIIISIYFCIFIHAVVFIAFEVQHIWSMIAKHSTCATYHTGVTCACVRITIHFFSLSLAMLQVGLCIDRTFATICSEKHEKLGIQITTAYCIVVIFGALIASIVIDYTSVDETFISCLNNSKVNRARVDLTNYALTAANCVTIIWLIAIYERNKFYSRKLDIGLSNRYQVQENISSTRLTIVIGCTQLLFFTAHLALNMSRRAVFTTMSTVLYRILESVGYLLTYYSFILPLVMYVYIKRDMHNKITSLQNTINRNSSRGVEGTNLYFSMYGKHW